LRCNKGRGIGAVRPLAIRGDFAEPFDSPPQERTWRAMAGPRNFEHLARARRRVSLVLTSAMLAIYFGFILSVAFAKRFMGGTIVPGAVLGILLGALVIGAAFGLTGVYVRWANRHDAAPARSEERP
jgi:uncharacterized membrane protein (DUF485 family)